MRPSRSAAISAAALLAGALSLTACSPPVACTDVGWSNRIRVTVTGDTAAVDRLDYCAGFDCTPVPNTPPPTTPSHTGDIWTLYIDMTTPRLVHISALDASGAELATREFRLDWKRVGGTPECGGPELARISLDIP
jgi:hypothetical protein